MSNYTSENTHIMATHDVKHLGETNTRMLLMHEREDKRIPYEYIIGSYFTEERKSTPEPRMAVRLRNESKSFAPAMRGYGTRNLLEDLADEVLRFHPSEIVHYSWHWGHYFDDVVHAVDYWKREVIGEDTDRFMCPDCSGNPF